MCIDLSILKNSCLEKREKNPKGAICLYDVMVDHYSY
jgi:hypothetical protein